MMTPHTRILIVTQAVDLDNPVLGFFHRWVEELATRFDSIVVVCLFEGRHSLPPNVEVFSLGKEKKEAYKVQYTQRFLALVWGLRNHYDSVFVHMNQEYILVAGWLWNILGKRVYLWRNHYQPSALTGFTAFFCNKMFCTSRYSYIKKYSKTVIMPIGIDTEVFKPVNVARKESVLSIGRIAPSKRVEVLIDAIGLLAKDGVQLKAHIYGDALPEDREYESGLQKRVQKAHIEHLIEFHSAVRNADTPALYSAHETFVNCSQSGMYDKTIFEAAACGMLSLASSEDYAQVVDPRLSFDGAAKNLALKLKEILALSTTEKEELQKKSRALAEKNNVQVLGKRLAEEIH
ncbi:MAG: glycosyltransferase [bacterium]|nr:glycosyltransferase [bacterium]